MIFVYFARRYTSRVTGKIRKSVSCEKCGSSYSYLAVRQAVGGGVSPYMLNNQGAADRAAEAAKRTLDDKLQSACEVVPCPRCGWVQARMVAEARRRRLRGMLKLGIIIPILTTVPYFLVAALIKEEFPGMNLFVIAVAAIALSLVPARMLLNSCFDPNVNAGP